MDEYETLHNEIRLFLCQIENEKLKRESEIALKEVKEKMEALRRLLES